MVGKVVVLHLGSTNLSLNLAVKLVEEVNAPISLSYTWANIPLFLLTLLVNAWALVVIRSREVTDINNLIIWDCVANVATMAINGFQQSPWCVAITFPICIMCTLIESFLVNWNKLVPVAIALFRYLLVCQPVLCQNHGDRRIWRLLRAAVILTSLANTSLYLASGVNSKTFFTCLGKEETFWYLFDVIVYFLTLYFVRFNLEDFFADVGPIGLHRKGPLWAPDRLLINFILFQFVFLALKAGKCTSQQKIYI